MAFAQLEGLQSLPKRNKAKKVPLTLLPRGLELQFITRHLDHLDELGDLTLLSEERSPLAPDETDDPEERRDDVDGDEHAKHQGVVHERGGTLIDSDW